MSMVNLIYGPSASIGLSAIQYKASQALLKSVSKPPPCRHDGCVFNPQAKIPVILSFTTLEGHGQKSAMENKLTPKSLRKQSLQMSRP